MERALIPFIIFLIANQAISSPLNLQTVIEGRVVDYETAKPLAFVNIVYNKNGTGTTTSLNGFFSIKPTTTPEFLKLSYVGYESEVICISDKDFNGQIVLKMKKKPYLLDEVTVKPGINPAHRIIGLAYQNRRHNDPEMLSSFSYTSYNKLFFTMLPDSLISRTTAPGSADFSVNYAFAGRQSFDDEMMADSVASISNADSNEIRIKEFIEKQHLFLMETVSKREYLYPGRNNEEVIATRVSGFKDPSFTLLATQLQSFSFYDDHISLLEHRYINPISRGSTSRYSFILEDSMFTENNDTLFIISFRPYPKRNFDGLQGVVYINSNGYAVQNVITEPFGKRRFFNIRIQQNYSLIDQRQWFPAELNTDIIFGSEDVSDSSRTEYNLVGSGKTYLSDIVIEPRLSLKKFNNVELKIAPDAHLKSEYFWDYYRIEPLSEKDKKTYHVIDSIGAEADFDRTFRLFGAYTTGYVPWGFLNFDYTSFLGYNYFEGFRPGIRVLTNELISHRFYLGGHIAWGFKDRELKYGAEAGITLNRMRDINLGISYSKDVEEAGSYNFLGRKTLFSSENYRRFIIERMDYVENYMGSVDFRLMRHLKSRFYLSLSEVKFGDDYTYFNGGLERRGLRFTETGVMLRYSYREKLIQTPGGKKISMGTDFPVVWFNMGRGLDFIFGDYKYTRVQAGLSGTFFTKSLGNTSVMIEGGIVDSDVPLQKLYNGKASYRKFSYDAVNSFATMRMNEFYSSEFIHFFFRHNFENLLFRSGNFRPELLLVTNIGFGKTADSLNHLNIRFEAPEKGFYESGLIFNNLLRKFFMSHGFGVFYRYGPYAFEKPVNNFALKLTFSINLR